MSNITERASKIVIRDNLATVMDKDDKTLTVVSSDAIAQKFFSRSRTPIHIYEMSLRWMSQSHLAFIHERPPRMTKITINEKLYYIPIPWTVTGTVFDGKEGKIIYSKMFFAQSQLSYPDQELFFCELPCVNPSGNTFKEGQFVNITDSDEIFSAITSTYIINDRSTYRTNGLAQEALHETIYEKFFDKEKNKFDHYTYLNQLGELSLKDGLYVQRKPALTLGDMIEQIESLDKRINSHFYQENNSFNALLGMIEDLIHQQEMMDYIDEDEEEDAYHEPEEDQEEPF